jgi:hypothetical protein
VASDLANLADPADVLPAGRDRDGHDAKCGYGGLHAGRACAGARDPFALALVEMGEDAAAAAWCGLGVPYSAELARWAVRVLIERPDLDHALRVVARHARLIAADPRRGAGQVAGALTRHLVLLARGLVDSEQAPDAVRDELTRALEACASQSGTGDAHLHELDRALLSLLGRPWRQPWQEGASDGDGDTAKAFSFASFRA